MLSPAFEDALAMARKGRARKSGPRHPGGQRKQTGVDPIAPAQWQRILLEAKKKTIDGRLGTELGRLFLHAELTGPQVAAGFRVARIYQQFERLHGKRRSPASPDYGTGGGDYSIADELLNEQSRAELEDRFLEVSEKFEALDNWMAGNVSREIRGLVQELCVEDRHIGPMTAEVRGALDRLGLFFGFTSVKHAHKQREASTPHRTDPRKPNLDRVYWIEVMRRLRPDLSEVQLGRAYDVQRALVARAILRRAPKTPRGNVVYLRSSTDSLEGDK